MKKQISKFKTTDKREWYRKVYLKSDHWQIVKHIKLCSTPICEACDAGINLDVHHLNYREVYNVKFKDLMTLCRKCHGIIHESNLHEASLTASQTIFIIKSVRENRRIESRDLILGKAEEIRESEAFSSVKENNNRFVEMMRLGKSMNLDKDSAIQFCEQTNFPFRIKVALAAQILKKPFGITKEKYREDLSNYFLAKNQASN